MPSETDIQKRDRALIALLALTGIRVAAAASMRLKHVFDDRIEQHPQEVKTKYSKKIVTYYFPISDFLMIVFVEWMHFLKYEKLWGNNSPLFPNTKLSLDENDRFSRQELDTVEWQSTTSIRTIVKVAFESAGLEYYNPHSFRNTLVNLGYKYCKTPEEFKAWSQNIGHSSPLTTFTSYGSIDEFSQGEIIKRLMTKNQAPQAPFTEKELLRLKRLAAEPQENGD
jgi:integrase